MTQIEVVFLKSGVQYGYRQPAGAKGLVYTNDIPFLVANGVIEDVPVVEVNGEQEYKPKKKGLLAKIFGK